MISLVAQIVTTRTGIAYVQSDYRRFAAVFHLRDRAALPARGRQRDLGKMDLVTQKRVRMRKDEALYRIGNRLTAIYAVRFGMLKTHVSTENGCRRSPDFTCLAKSWGWTHSARCGMSPMPLRSRGPRSVSCV